MLTPQMSGTASQAAPQVQVMLEDDEIATVGTVKEIVKKLLRPTEGAVARLQTDVEELKTDVTDIKESLLRLELAVFGLTQAPTREFEGKTCPICYDEMVQPEDPHNEWFVAWKTKCGHIFHRKCLNQWQMAANFTCPVCRYHMVQDFWDRSRRAKRDSYMAGTTPRPVTLWWLFFVRPG